MISLLGLLTAFALLTISSYTDLKTKEVPDFVSGFGVMIGGVAKVFFFALNPARDLMISYLIFLGIITLFSTLLYRAGQWGGGDLKLMVGLALLLPFKSITPLPLLLVFLLTFPLVAGAYGVIGAFWLITNNPKTFWKSFKKKVFRVISITTIIVGFSLFPLREFELTFPLLVFSATMYVLLEVVSSSEECMIKKIPVSKLTEGDWVVEEVKKDSKTLYKPAYHGVTKKDIKKFKEEGVKKVTIKDGIPFVPAFLLTLIVSVLTQESVNAFLTRLF